MSAFLILIVMGVIFYLYKKAKKNALGHDGGYSKEEISAGTYKFKVVPNTVHKIYLTAGRKASILIYGVFWYLIFEICTGMLSSREDVLRPVLVAVAFAMPPTMFVRSIIKGFVQRAVHKEIGSQPREFSVNRNGISVEGITVPTSSITRLIVRNVIEQRMTSSWGESCDDVMYDVQAPNIKFGDPDPFFTRVKFEHQKPYDCQVAYRVLAEAGANRYLLASALDQSQAFGLMREVADILNLEVR